MAISFVGSKAGGYSSTSTQSISLTDLFDSGGFSATLLQNDLIVIAICHSMATTASRTLAQLTPAGYSAPFGFGSSVQANDSNAVSLVIVDKFMGATPDTTVTLPACAASTNSIAYVIEAWRGVDTTTPFDTNGPTTVSGSNTGLADPPSISTPSTPAGCVVIGCFGAAVASASVFTNSGATPYDSTTNVFKSGTQNTATNRSVAGMGAKTGLAVSTAFNAAITGSTTTNTGSWAAISVTMRPAATAITYNETISESVTAGFSETAAATFALSLSESMTAGYSYTETATFVPALSESATAAFTPAALATLVPTFGETVVADDSVSPSLTIPASLTEAATAADSLDAGLTIPVSLSESTTVDSIMAGGVLYSLAISEVLAMTDDVSAYVAFDLFLTEAATANEGIDAQAVFQITIADSVTLDTILAQTFEPKPRFWNPPPPLIGRRQSSSRRH